MPHARRRLQIDEVSLCREPANPGALVALFKRANLDDKGTRNIGKGLSQMDKLAEFLKTLKDDQRTIVEDALKEAGDALVDARKSIDAATETQTALEASIVEKDAEIAKLKTAVADDGTKPIDKSKLPPETVEQIEALEKARKGDAERIAKLESDKDDAEINKSLDELTHLTGDRDELFKALKGATADQRTAMLVSLKAAHEMALKGQTLLEEIGQSGGTAGGEAIEQVAQLAADLQKDNPKMSVYQARARIWKSNPDLKKRYEAERKAAH